MPRADHLRLPVVLFAGFFGIAGSAVLGQTAEAKTFRIASLAPQESSWGRLLMEMTAQVERETQGGVQLRLYLGGKLGDEAKVAQKLGRGLHGAFFTGQGVGLILPAFRVQELPFLVENYQEADKLRAALWPELEKAFERDTKAVLLGPGETGQVYLFSRSKISTLEELRQAKLWVWQGDQVASETFKVFGVSPRPLDILTVVQELKSGGVDTVYNSPAGAVALGWTGDLQYVSGRNFAYASGGFVLTKQAWQQIPPEHQKIVKHVVDVYAEKIIQQARRDNEAALARLTETGGGLKQVPITDAKYQEFKKVGMAAWPELAEAISAGALLAQARKALSK